MTYPEVQLLTHKIDKLQYINLYENIYKPK